MNNELNLETKNYLPTYDEIINGRELLNKFIKKTLLYKSNTFSNLIGTNVYLKNEAFQKTGSFKVRGALYKIKTLPEEKIKYGIIAASAGNHAQGVAYAATIRKVPCTIVMPMYASPAKIAAVRSYNAQVILKGKDYDEAWTAAKEIAEKENKAVIHAFDDPEVIAGQGSIGLELLEDLPDLDEIYIPVGGGGLAAGIAIAVKSKKRNVKIIGVESKAFPAMKESIEKGSLQSKKGEFTIADGISVKAPGKLTYEIAKRYLDDIVLIDDKSIVKTMFLLMERSKLVIEPAGAASLAYLLANGHKNSNKKVVSILSGGNVDMYLLGQVVAKGLLQMNRLLKIFIQLTDKPGALKTVVDGISALHVNIVEVIHDRLSANIAAGTAGVYLSLELENQKHCDLLINYMKKKGIDFKIVN
ncbi:MAG TPA: threonine ammonia-lyase [Nitrososphaeraceae archaeon]|jgi:threonine dehydratase|nr:threonine ammonia-lyase [Nitrososphaeraceae archaeon]